jgi:condensin complex subunit 3
LLLGILPPQPTAEILKAFTLTYFDPETATNPALRQALSYFLPVFCHSKLKNAKLMGEIAVPVISKLLIMRDENVEEDDMDEMVGWPVITAHLAEWTDGRKVVGATELGLDGKTSTTAEAEEPHIQLAIEILERALTSTCSKDERKPLLSLLGKLFIAPSGASHKSSNQSTADEEEEEPLHTLHSLVSEAVEGKIGTDATQRNALAKLEATLTKRLGEVGNATQAPDEEADHTAVPDTTVAPDETEADDATEVPERQVQSKKAPKIEQHEEDDEDEEDEDTMLAGMQGEGTRMPLEADDDDDDDDEEEEEEEEGQSVAEHSTLIVGRDDRKRNMVTEEDIMESLLQSEMEDSA